MRQQLQAELLQQVLIQQQQQQFMKQQSLLLQQRPMAGSMAVDLAAEPASQPSASVRQTETPDGRTRPRTDRKALPAQATMMLKQWWNEHYSWPYPTVRAVQP